MIGISVIVCCYNSEDKLPETIKHLAQQRVISGFAWEIVVIDNASIDQTNKIAVATWAQYQIKDVNFKMITEIKQGLSYARQRGAEEALYEYIIFCDDDNWLKANFLEQAFTLIKNNKKIGALGGQSTAVSDIELPSWFEKYKHGYAVGKQGTVSGDITKREYVWGAGLITRKSLFLDTINEQYPSLLHDRKGNSITSGGDCEYCLRLILKGYKIYYHESLVFKHYISVNRLTEVYRDKLFKSFKESDEYLNKYREALELKKISSLKKIVKLISASVYLIESLLTGKQLKQSSSNYFFYFLNITHKHDKNLRIIKHFYDT